MLGLERQQTQHKKVKLTFIGVFIGLILASIFHFILMGNKNYPENTFLFTPLDRFMDFINCWEFSIHLNPYFEDASPVSNYFPFANLILYLFTFFKAHTSLIIFLLLYVASYLCATIWFSRKNNLNFIYMIGIVFFSYPFLFNFDRANIEWILPLLTIGFFVLNREKMRKIGIVLLSSAIAMKAYPAIFLVFLVSRAHFKYIFYSIIITLALTITSLLLFQGTLSENIHFILSGFGIQDEALMPLFQSSSRVFPGISLYFGLKALLLELNMIYLYEFVNINSLYIVFVLICIALIGFHIVFLEKHFWKKVTLLVLSICLFPHISGDYKLLFIFIPLFLFLIEKPEKWDSLYILFFVLLLIPKEYITLDKINPSDGSGVIATPFIMFFFMCFIILQRNIDLYKSNKYTNQIKTAFNRMIKKSDSQGILYEG